MVDLPPQSPEFLDAVRRAAEQGDVQARIALSTWLARGHYFPENQVEATFWLQLAADQGHVGAYKALGDRVAMGAGARPDPVEALKWYKIALAYGNEAAPAPAQELQEGLSEIEVADSEKRAQAWLRSHPSFPINKRIPLPTKSHMYTHLTEPNEGPQVI